MPLRDESREEDPRICIYCSESKAPAEFSREHIIPQFMGVMLRAKKSSRAMFAGGAILAWEGSSMLRLRGDFSRTQSSTAPGSIV